MRNYHDTLPIDIPDLLYFSITSGNLRTEGQLVEHGDLLRVCKQVQEGCVAGLEPRRELAIRLFVSGLLLFVSSRANRLNGCHFLGQFPFDTSNSGFLCGCGLCFTNFRI